MSILQFPSVFFEDEVREGFYVSGMMKRAWAVQMEALAQIDQICERHQIRWFADCGTLMGAVRHGGFIPWDDDLDICMLRDDFDRFKQVLVTEMPEGYVDYDVFEATDYYQPQIRFVRGSEIHVDSEYLEQNFQFPYMAGVDIFPLDYVSEDQEAEQIRKDLILLINKTTPLFPDGIPLTDAHETMLEQIEQSCQVRIDRRKSIRRQLFAIQEGLYAMFPSEGAKHVVFMKYWIEANNHLFPAELFEKTIELPFEHLMVKAPAKYDAVLRIEYGDYSKNVRGGSVHDYPFYTAQENRLKSVLGERNPFDYVFTKEQLHNEVRELWQQYPKLVQDFVVKMNQNFCEMEKRQEEEKVDAILTILETCQNDAIELGNQIEQSRGEGHESVKLLEQFCEHIFACYQGLASETGGILDLTMLRGDMVELIAILREKREKKEIVFLPFAAKHWKAMESMWKKANDNPDLNVYVVPIPYCDKTLDGQVIDMHYDVQDYPEYVTITDCTAYDFVRRHPDVIVTQNPYDEYGSTISVHPDFYTRKLRQYTEKVVYVPYFMIDELLPEDEIGKQTMNYFVPVPGVMLADEIIAQSEQMKQSYIDNLVAHAGEETRAHWEEIIKGTGLPLAEYEPSDQEKLQEAPAAWKELLTDTDGSMKKVILYTASTSCIIERGEQALKKMKSAFEIFDDSKDKVVCIWRPHPQMETILQDANPAMLRAYQELVGYFVDKKIGIIDRLPSADNALKLADAYYGDAGSIMQKCLRKKIPIMVQNYEIM